MWSYQLEVGEKRKMFLHDNSDCACFARYWRAICVVKHNQPMYSLSIVPLSQSKSLSIKDLSQIPEEKWEKWSLMSEEKFVEWLELVLGDKAYNALMDMNFKVAA